MNGIENAGNAVVLPPQLPVRADQIVQQKGCCAKISDFFRNLFVAIGKFFARLCACGRIPGQMIVGPRERRRQPPDVVYNILNQHEPRPLVHPRGFPLGNRYPHIQEMYGNDPRCFRRLETLSRAERDQFEELIANQGNHTPAMARHYVHFLRRINPRGEIDAAAREAALGLEHDMRGLSQRPGPDVIQNPEEFNRINIRDMMNIFDETYRGLRNFNDPEIVRLRRVIEGFLNFIDNPRGEDEHYKIVIQQNTRKLIQALRDPNVDVGLKLYVFEAMNGAARLCNPRRMEEMDILASNITDGAGPRFDGWGEKELIFFHSIVKWNATDREKLLHNAFNANFHFINYAREVVGDRWGLRYPPDNDWAEDRHLQPQEFDNILYERYVPALEIENILNRISRSEKKENAREGFRELCMRVMGDEAARDFFLVVDTEDQPESFFNTRAMPNARPLRWIPNAKMTAFVLEQFGFLTRQGQREPPVQPFPRYLLPQSYIEEVGRMRRVNAEEELAELNEKIAANRARLDEPRWNAQIKAIFERLIEICEAKIITLQARINALGQQNQNNIAVEIEEFVEVPERLAPNQQARIDAMDREEVEEELAQFDDQINAARQGLRNPNLNQMLRLNFQARLGQREARHQALIVRRNALGII